MAITLDDTVVRNPDVLSADLSAQTVLMSVENGMYYGLSATSQDIWQRLSSPVLVRDLCDTLSASYQAPLAQVEQDTLAFLVYLEGRGLLRIAPASAQG